MDLNVDDHTSGWSITKMLMRISLFGVLVQGVKAAMLQRDVDINGLV